MIMKGFGAFLVDIVKEFVITDATESVTTDSQEVVGKLSR